MPYGSVMATGGAGAAANLCGLHDVATALTGIAVLQAVLIPVGTILAWRRIPSLRCRFGSFTIPLGLAVIAINLQALAPAVGNVALALAWLMTLALGCWLIVSAGFPGGLTERVDGTWFLAPAALLGDAAATAFAAEAGSKWEIWLAVIACLAGVAGYALVIAASARWLRDHGLSSSPLSPWWISAGCGGLAAAALGRVADKVPGAYLHRALDELVAMTWVVGTILLVAVLIGCWWYASRRPHGPWSHAWTTVFSVAVYAAGTDRFARLNNAGALKAFTMVAAAATLALWAVNSALRLRGMRLS